MSSENVVAHMVAMFFSCKQKAMVLENNFKSAIQTSSLVWKVSFPNQTH